VLQAGEAIGNHRLIFFNDCGKRRAACLGDCQPTVAAIIGITLCIDAVLEQRSEDLAKAILRETQYVADVRLRCKALRPGECVNQPEYACGFMRNDNATRA
jgi:hypothetical protein